MWCLLFSFLAYIFSTYQQNIYQKKFGRSKYPSENFFRLIKYQRKKTLDPQNTHEKDFWTHEIPTRKNFGPMKYLKEKNSDPQNTHE